MPVESRSIPKSTADTKTGTTITEKATVQISDGVGKQALWLSKSVECLGLEISIPTI